MFEITGLSVISAVGERLSEIFPDAKWYREGAADPVYPCVFVRLADFKTKEDGYGKWWLDYAVNIEYRIEKSPALSDTLLEDLNFAGHSLVSGLTEIFLGTKPVKVRDARYDIRDSVLKFSAHMRLRGVKAPENTEKMVKLSLSKKLG